MSTTDTAPISADRKWRWNGAEWQPLHSGGKHVWDGTRWVPIETKEQRRQQRQAEREEQQRQREAEYVHKRQEREERRAAAREKMAAALADLQAQQAERDRQQIQRSIPATRTQVTRIYSSEKEFQRDQARMDNAGWDVVDINGISYRSLGKAAVGAVLTAPVPIAGALIGGRRRSKITVVYQRRTA